MAEAAAPSSKPQLESKPKTKEELEPKTSPAPKAEPKPETKAEPVSVKKPLTPPGTSSLHAQLEMSLCLSLHFSNSYINFALYLEAILSAGLDCISDLKKQS